MEFLKNLFKDDEKIIGLCAFKKRERTVYSFTPAFSSETNLIYKTNYSQNIFLN